MVRAEIYDSLTSKSQLDKAKSIIERSAEREAKFLWKFKCILELANLFLD